MLKNKKILLGVTGSISVYKSLDLTRRLVEDGAKVNVIMTDAAKRFVAPLSFEIASQSRVYSDIFIDPMSHITLTADADLMAVAPATANSIGKFANGIADDMLSACFLAFRGKVIVAPAMNWRMYESPAVRRNLEFLSSHGALQVGPEKGSLACGENAVGRMADVRDIIRSMESAITGKDLSGKRIIVTAGPTREYIDPIRFISNRSSGKMGYEIAGAAAGRGADVILISGPSFLKPPSNAEFEPVVTALEMRDAVLKHIGRCDAVIMAAAVADFSSEEIRADKIEKSDKFVLNLIRTPDILAEIGSTEQRPLLIGFAAETGGYTGRAKKKLLSKKADLIVFNNVLSSGSGFDVDTNEVTIIEKDREASLPLMTKREVADKLLDRIAEILKKE